VTRPSAAIQFNRKFAGGCGATKGACRSRRSCMWSRWKTRRRHWRQRPVDVRNGHGRTLTVHPFGEAEHDSGAKEAGDGSIRSFAQWFWDGVMHDAVDCGGLVPSCANRLQEVIFSPHKAGENTARVATEHSRHCRLDGQSALKKSASWLPGIPNCCSSSPPNRDSMLLKRP